MTTNSTQNAAPLDPHALTPAELAYAQSGDTDALVKEGLIKPEGIAQPQETQPPQSPPPPLPPAQADDDDGEPELDSRGRPKQRGQWVNKKALDAERAERQRLAQQLSERTEQWTRLEERFKVFQEALTVPEPREEETEEDLPDPEQDIIGFNRALAQRMDRRFARLDEALNGINQQVGQVNEQTVAQQRQTEMLNFYSQDAAEFSREKQNDFPEAYRFLIASRNAELEAAGYNDARERQRLIRADEQALVARAIENRASPAERIYALAKARGYQVKAPANGANGATNGASGAGNGAAPQQQQQNQQQPSVTDEIARLQKGQEASLSLSNVGGGRPNPLSVEQLADMPQEEFNKLMRKNPGMVEALLGKGQ